MSKRNLLIIGSAISVASATFSLTPVVLSTIFVVGSSALVALFIYPILNFFIKLLAAKASANKEGKLHSFLKFLFAPPSHYFGKRKA